MTSDKKRRWRDRWLIGDFIDHQQKRKNKKLEEFGFENDPI